MLFPLRLPVRFLTHHNLQGSQTLADISRITLQFLTHHNLQGSQTIPYYKKHHFQFLTHHNLQGSQTRRRLICHRQTVSYPS